jgi:hypothetical protein
MQRARDGEHARSQARSRSSSGFGIKTRDGRYRSDGGIVTLELDGTALVEAGRVEWDGQDRFRIQTPAGRYVYERSVHPVSVVGDWRMTSADDRDVHATWSFRRDGSCAVVGTMNGDGRYEVIKSHLTVLSEQPRFATALPINWDGDDRFRVTVDGKTLVFNKVGPSQR